MRRTILAATGLPRKVLGVVLDEGGGGCFSFLGRLAQKAVGMEERILRVPVEDFFVRFFFNIFLLDVFVPVC